MICSWNGELAHDTNTQILEKLVVETYLFWDDTKKTNNVIAVELFHVWGFAKEFPNVIVGRTRRKNL